jgi:hypothetical protein
MMSEREKFLARIAEIERDREKYCCGRGCSPGRDEPT